ncbi:MAG: hypothetical protein WC374_01705 [Phycisphaerae bacterium]
MKAMFLGTATGMVSSILPGKFGSVIIGAGLSALSNAYSNYQKSGDFDQAFATGINSFGGALLGGGLSFGLGLRLQPYMGFGTSKNIMETMGLISFIWGEGASSVSNLYLTAPIENIGNIEERMSNQKEDLQKIGF